MSGPKQIIPVFVDAPPRCPGCGKTLRMISGNGMPKAGDFNVCAECLVVLRFIGDGFACRFALAEELEQCIAAGELEEKDAELLRMCFAAAAERKGIST